MLLQEKIIIKRDTVCNSNGKEYAKTKEVEKFSRKEID